MHHLSIYSRQKKFLRLYVVFSPPYVSNSATSASNYGEAQGAESRSDFIRKMKLRLKRLCETKVWSK